MQDAIILYENGKAIGGEGHPTNASDITFDNSNTDLVSENVENAIKEAYGKSAKSADLTSISESGSTASQAISAGTYFYLDGTLVRAKVAIANGATFTLNTNYEVVTDGALNESVIYSTDEHVVGKWIDGSVLYEKTVDFGALPNNTTKVVNHNISNIKRIVEIKAIASISQGASYPLPYIDTSNQATGNLGYSVTTAAISVATKNNWSSINGYFTLRYTKTS